MIGCASSPNGASTVARVPVPSPSAEAAAPSPVPPAASDEEVTPAKSGVEAWAEKKSRHEELPAPADTRDTRDTDPLSVGAAIESGTTTKVEITPARELRTKTRRDLDDGMKLAEKTATFEEAVKKLTARLGKPTWIENGKKRVWVANDGQQCHRLVLDTDGSLEAETEPTGTWKMLSGFSQQNACSGVVQRGVPGMQSP
jgi:hypothetical protein